MADTAYDAGPLPADRRRQGRARRHPKQSFAARASIRSTSTSMRNDYLVECCFCKLKQYRAIATRYDENHEKFPRRNPSRGRHHLAQLRTGPRSIGLLIRLFAAWPLVGHPRSARTQEDRNGRSRTQVPEKVPNSVTSRTRPAGMSTPVRAQRKRTRAGGYVRRGAVPQSVAWVL